MSLIPVVHGTALRLGGSVATDGVSLQQRQRSTRTYLGATAVLHTPAAPDADADASTSSQTRPTGAAGAPKAAASRAVVPVDMSLTATAVVLDQHGGGGQVSYVDRVTRQTRVMPRGFPQLQSSGGMVAAPGDAQEWTLSLPNDVVPGSLAASVAVYPTPVASITKVRRARGRGECGEGVGMTRRSSGSLDEPCSRAPPPYLLPHRLVG